MVLWGEGQHGRNLCKFIKHSSNTRTRRGSPIGDRPTQDTSVSCVIIMTIYGLIFIIRIIYGKWYLFIFDAKMTISPRKVRYVSPSRDVWICLAAKYLHIDIFDQILKKVWIFCAARWERKQEIQGSPPVVTLEGDGTAD